MSTERFLRKDKKLVPVLVPALVPVLVPVNAPVNAPVLVPVNAPVNAPVLAPLRGQIQAQEEYEYPEADVNYTGRKLTHELKKGPIEQRVFKNVNCLITFLIMWAMMIITSILIWGKGNPWDVYKPYDSKERQCGRKATKDYPYIYLLSELEYYCVSSCPEKSDVGQILPCYHCPAQPIPYPTIVHFTMCFPTKEADEKYRKLGYSANMFGFAQEQYADIQEGWTLILCSAVFSIIFSTSILLMIRFAAGCVVWGMVVLIFLLLEGLGVLSFFKYRGYRFDYIPLYEDENPYSLIIEGCMFCGGGVIALIAVFILAKKIRQAIYILKAAGDFISQELPIIFVPFLMSILMIGVIAYCLVFQNIILSTTTQILKDPKDPYVRLDPDQKTAFSLCTFYFGLIWTVSFINGLTHFVVGTCCSYWYYSHQGCPRKGSILKGYQRGLTKNFGSILYGAAVFPLVWVIKQVLSQYSSCYKFITNVTQQNPLYCLQFLYCKCYLRCFDKVIKVLDRNAYTLMSLTGQDFCLAAYDAFFLVYRNSTRVAITQGLGEIFQLLGVAFITIISSIICIFMMLSDFYDFSEYFTLVALFAFTSGFTAHTFLSLYGYGVDTILFCLIVDFEQNVNEGGPKSVPPILKKYTLDII
ncbi:unnamed protein product [Paramecium octaurelia]|uniref:Choline transporter-like protein n=1 Tax=Paramecium octaurelia TaxID=43137 RepID=A0A8S1XTY7_PAROT|nr:unnamed protein product [Paramecium octaurelia]